MSETRLSQLVIPKYYSTFNETRHSHKIFTSGRAGTKSSRGAIKAIYTIVSPEPGAVVFIRKFHNKLSKTVFKECQRAITRLGYKKNEFKITKSPMQITYLKNGNTIYFTGNDSIDDTKGMIDEDRPIVLVIVDELTEFFDKGEGEDELVNINATFVRGNNGAFVMEYYFNPPKNDKSPIMQWTKKMEQRADCIHVHTDYRDVPVSWLGQKLIDEADAMLKADEKMYDWLWLGKCTGLDELIYYMFNESIHVQKTPDKYTTLRYIGIGCDYGQMNATTYQCFGLDFFSKKVVGLGEFYHSGRTSGHQKSPSEYAKELVKFVDQVESKTKQKVLFVVIDPSARGLAEEIKRIIPRLRIIPADNTVLKGINRFQKLLAFKAFVFDESQKNAIEEMSLYSWDMDLIDKGRPEQPIKDNDHAMDAIRYYIMYVWQYLVQMLPVLNERGDYNE